MDDYEKLNRNLDRILDSLSKANESSTTENEVIIPYITEIINHFDFERVHKAMIALNWEWWNDGDYPDGVPTVEQLKNDARKKLQKCLDTGAQSYAVECGGLRATKRDCVLKLQFVVDSWEVDIVKGRYNKQIRKG